MRLLAICRFFFADDGPTAVEYAVVVSLVMLAAAGGVASIGSATSSPLDTTASQLSGSGGSGKSSSKSKSSKSGKGKSGKGKSGKGKSGKGSRAKGS